MGSAKKEWRRDDEVVGCSRENAEFTVREGNLITGLCINVLIGFKELGKGKVSRSSRS